MTTWEWTPLIPLVSTVHFVGGEKGGVGKSVVSRLLCQYCIDKGKPLAGVDADASHGALVRYYGEYSQPVDLESFESADHIMDRALGSERAVLVDLPAQSSRLLRRWIGSGDVLSFAREMGVTLYFWHVTDGGFDSVNELENAFGHFASSMKFVVVKNHGRSIDFSQFDESPVLQKLTAAGGLVLDLPLLHAATMYKIDKKGSSFWAAMNSLDESLVLLPMEKQRTKLWLRDSYQALDQVFA